MRKDAITGSYTITHHEWVEPERPSSLEIPVSVFSTHLSPLRALVKYLKEEEGLNYSDIAGILKRDPRTIWTSYNECGALSLKRFSGPKIAVDELVVEGLTVFEALVLRLSLKGYAVSEIATLLRRSYQTIRTVRDRALLKGGGRLG